MITFIKIITALSISLFFISCGDNTLEHITSDIQKIEIDQNDVTSIYSTDKTSLSSSVFYMDGTNADVTYDVSWENSDYNVTTLNKNILIPIVNSGDANITVKYKDISDKITVTIIGLKDINNSWKITRSDIETTGDFELKADGNFSDGVNNKPIIHNITWSSSNSDDIITIEEDYSIKINISTVGDRNITATLFDVNKTVSYTVYSKI